MRIRCVAGLGNPGLRYEWTRHNAGFWVADRVADEAHLRWRRLEGAREATGEVGGRGLVLLKPLTYMNNSGEAVLACLERHRLAPGELLVVVDDVALPAGRLRLRPGGSAGGHRGLISVEASLGSRDYARLRVGVAGARTEEDLADYVLRPLDEEEKALFEKVARRGAGAVLDVLREGLGKAMNRHNPIAADESDAPAPRTGDSGAS